MKILYMGTAAAEGWPALFCSCPICTHARKMGGHNLRTRTQALLDGSLLIDFPRIPTATRFDMAWIWVKSTHFRGLGHHRCSC